jgi:uncharacterized protein
MKTEKIIKVFVRPSSSMNSIEGMFHDEIKIKIAAPPEKNKANKELVKFLSAKLCIPKKDIKITSGLKSNHKEITLYNNLNIKISELFK